MRKISVAQAGRNLLSVLREMSVNVPAFCGGTGKCGKCRVQISEAGSDACLPVSAAEEKVFTAEQLKKGWRLACMQEARTGMTVLVPEEENMQIETGFWQAAEGRPVGEEGTSSSENSGNPDSGTMPQKPVIAVDIGTTTLAAALVDAADGNVVRTASGINRQRRWGADVISRIDASNKGNGALLQESIQKDLRDLKEQLLQGVEIGNKAKEEIPSIIAGNTTMEHLLLGYSCETLGVAPYDPVDISLQYRGDMTILPGISTYVGADIVSGIIACGMDEKEEISLLVDLGTNGEMAIGNRNRILATSTAAGPAFEGGNISCGTAGIPGAIDTVTIDEDGNAAVTTIAGEAPKGLCGTGVLEVVYELLKTELLDETGLLDDDYFDDGYPLAEKVVFTQQDVREVQLAKAAVRAGIETLTEIYGIEPEEIAHLYLAGGFGKKINVEKAAGIGLLPEELVEKTVAVGNSSLAGAVLFAADPAMKERFVRVAGQSEEVKLAETKAFTEHYMNAMFFG